MFSSKLEKVFDISIIQPVRARAVTGRRCPHSGEGEDFLTGQPGFFFTKTAVTPEQKIVPKVENERPLPGLRTARL